MKRKYIHVFSVVFCMFVLLSCSDEDENAKSENNLIVGKWQLSNSTDPDTENCLYVGYTEFKENGSYDDHTGCNNADGGGSWSINGNDLTMTANILPIPVIAKIKELTETTLILELQLLDLYTSTDTYKRVK